ncbi:DUF3426 domain-containing protein [Pararhodospirillum oryzae]|uniref:Zinc finger/thioredoxin putative domain-containing protein n=1 Tax=Pararhodospirillum oryzae TaxID=478448 RepID=A0A512H957_9PROT|nr:DUF3426 domain-containing protein [Pararhodospirillum oryzae]GEO81985.1 hypothetical protein ROR02_21160 [Pararhodospirillum oryzae]
MIITCPSCAAKFNLPESALGSKGRTLRCAKCGHTWHHPPAGADDFDDDPDPFAAPPPARPQPAPPPARAPAPDLDALPFERDPEGAPPKAPATNFDQELSKLEDMLGKLPGGEFMESKPGRGRGRTTLDDDLDDDEPRKKRRGDDIEDLDALLASTDPDPIPRVFTGPRPTKRGPGTGLLKAVVALLVALWVVALAGYFLRAQAVALVPALGSLYALLGIDTGETRDTVIFQNVVSTLEAQGDRRVLVVRGLLFNPSAEERPVPELELVVMDEDGKVLQRVRDKPPQPTLAAGAQMPFQITMENPSQLARDFRILFSSSD